MSLPLGSEQEPASPPPDDTDSYRIFVRDLVLPCRIGVHLHEKQLPQRVRINIDLTVMDSCAAAGDDIARVLSYEHIVNRVKGLIAEGHVNLVETLAERIAGLCLGDGRVRRARVRVEKLDVVPEADCVGVEIERRRDAGAQAASAGV